MFFYIVYATKNFLLNKNQYVCGEVVYLATKATSVNHSAHICWLEYREFTHMMNLDRK